MTITPRVLLVAALLGLAGCGLYKWQKPGAGDAAFKADSAACQRTNNPDGYSPCMRQRGWTLDD